MGCVSPKFGKDMSHDRGGKIGNYNRSFAVGIILNIAFVVIEVGYGVFADSLALIADAGHNLGSTQNTGVKRLCRSMSS
jgi:Co/Zn/Cd efflux system component